MVWFKVNIDDCGNVNVFFNSLFSIFSNFKFSDFSFFALFFVLYKSLAIGLWTCINIWLLMLFLVLMYAVPFERERERER